MSYIEHKYVTLLSNRLERFTKVNSKTYNFRCPLCGDSKKNLYKSRGYIIEKDKLMLYYCHNCGASLSFKNFLKQIDQSLHDDYVRESFLEQVEKKEEIKPDITKIVWPKYRLDSPLKTLKKISQLQYDHPAKVYIDKRKIPPKSHYKLFYTSKFKKWINVFIPDKFKDLSDDEPRIVIPFIDKEGNCFGVQGRSLKDDGVRYITIIFDESFPKMFGYDTVNLNKRVYVVEGPFDSLFVDNCIAMAGADLSLDKLPIPWTNDLVFVYDNEPRNKDIIRHMNKVIDKGYKLVIWPDTLEEKDINDMILNGKDVNKIINSNIYNDLDAKLKLSQWRKVK